MSEPPSQNVALVGLGSIGISFAALHLRFGAGTVTVFDTRPDLEQHIESVLPGYLSDEPDAAAILSQLRTQGRLVICGSLAEACADADVIQEQGPENIRFKREIWVEVEESAKPTAHFWSSTSGIGASLQSQDMKDPSRLLVVHPFNPPHIMPLIEIVPSPKTDPQEVEFARDYFDKLGSGHRPVVIKKEVPGFVGNRLAFTLLREASFLVKNDIVSVKDVDAIIEASLGPRFAVQGPFRAYHMGGGTAGIRAFLDNLGGTIQGVWDSQEGVEFGSGDRWEEKVAKQTEEAYGMPDPWQFAERDEKLRRVLDTQRK
ncbi:L-carnitine dehydrogenase-like protein [Hapsidospora chrysogenum ATCC 11550]|uniref:L-gulonate 3-dehydrogenase n=1 Tax=Hapsidospora chrysogenum (strain ATCC 11550 / CBS 779.69 / DSM 880 / IAM 14645 / JCM 23072 / IMI 49137) TaxID=857340 RepID=A0A086SY03_HAPC1|nr:L-carnitine dehydrogenase-like protein [Hapsidospora chrysogenum ATCC 11550]